MIENKEERDFSDIPLEEKVDIIGEGCFHLEGRIARIEDMLENITAALVKGLSTLPECCEEDVEKERDSDVH